MSGAPASAPAPRRQPPDWNATEAPFERDATIAQLFERQVDRRPDAEAVVDDGRSVTYLDLEHAANRIAHELIARGVAMETPVGLAMDRSLETVAAIVGILKAGGAYVPLDPSYPQERLRFMLKDAGAPVVVAQPGPAERLPDAGLEVLVLDPLLGAVSHRPTERPPQLGSGESLAYVMYTSGSTGQPKGVEIVHRGVLRLVRSTNYATLDEHLRVLQVGPLAFDPSSFELWGPLLNGGSIVVYPPGRPDPRRIGELVRRFEVNSALLVSGLLHQVVDDDITHLGGITQLLTGGDVLSPDHARRVVDELPDCRLVNLYGPTETTLCATYHVVGDLPPGESVPIGRPLANTTIHLLGDDGDLVRPGEVGEVHIGGDGVARGYLNRPELTAERFVPDPFSESPGARLYRTGDLARHRPDGELVFLGRADDQVKVRGYRIELGEVEAHLAAHPAVGQAAVVAREDLAGHKRLVGYVSPASGEIDATRPTPASLRAFLEGRLPSHMLPSSLQVVERFPITSTGKLDRAALADAQAVKAPDGADTSPPATALEREIAALWSDLLRIDGFGREDDFFELGGDSLLGTLVLGRLREQHGVELTIDVLFEEPTVAGLARRVGAAANGAAADGATGREALPPLAPSGDDSPAPLAPSQRPALFFQRLDPASVAYQFQARLTFEGRLDSEALERSLAELVRRHEVLRTTFEERDGEPVQIVHEPFVPTVEHIDLTSAADPGRELERLSGERFRRPFDVGKLPLVRWTLVRVATDRHVLLHVEHHLIHDGWSFSLLLHELQAIYGAYASGGDSPLAEPTLQFGDFARWQHALLDSEAGRRQLEWWRDEIEDVSPLELVGDRRRPPRRTLRGDSLRVALPDDLVDRLRTLGRSERTTLFATMLAAFAELLRRQSGQRDFAIGSGFANRRLTATEGMVGMAINTVALRMRLDGDPTARELIRSARQTILAALERQEVPFERVVAALRPDQGVGDLPIYQVLFSFHDSPQPTFDLPDLTVRVEGGLANGSAKADLNVIVVDQPGEPVELLWEFSTDLLSASAGQAMLDRYRALLESMAREPEAAAAELAPVAGQEAERLRRLGTGARTPFEREATVHEVFAAQVARTPDAPAVTDAYGGTIPYRELDRRANRLAHRLRQLGVRNESPVGIHLERNGRAVAALLAVLKAGGAYLPVDPEDPPERTGALLGRAGARVIVSDRDVPAAAAHGAAVVRVDQVEPSGLPDESPSLAGAPESLAYLMHTSGSSGPPKAVEVVHRGIVRLVRGADYAELGPGETSLAAAPLTFDASTFEIWGPLLNGGRVVVMPNHTPTLQQLEEVVGGHGVSVLWLTAGLFHEVVDRRPQLLEGVRQVLAGGDVLSPARVARALAARRPDQVLINGYGPTEATTFTCAHRMHGGDPAPDPVPIGKPIANTDVRVLDDRLRPVLAGSPGELFIGGDGLARGYRGEPELTGERFVEVAGERLYRTGDRVRWRPDGALDFLGRLDRQLKVRGFRIEPGEVEHALLEQEGVREAVVVGRDAPGGVRLAAYVVPAREGLTHADLRAHLGHRLPQHMIPPDWGFIDRIPLTRNGKVDRQALPAPSSPVSPSDAPGTALEQGIAAIFEDLLEVSGVSLDDDFFELGGHSLLAVGLVSEIERVLAVRLPLAAVFEAPTVRQLAREVREAVPDSAWDPLVALRPHGERPPLIAVSAGDGNVLAFAALARRLPPDQPLFALQPRGLDGRSRLDRSVEDMAATYLDELRSVRPNGPYFLMGRCLGATVAFEMAQRLLDAGEDVPLFVALDSDAPLLGDRLANGWPLDDRMRALRRRELSDVEIGDLLTPDGTDSFVAWLRAPVFRGDGFEITRYLHQAWRERPDLQEAWPDLGGEDGRYLARWAWEHGREEMGLLEDLLPPSPPEVGHVGRASPPNRLRSAVSAARRRGAAAGWRALDVVSPKPLPGARARLQGRLEAVSRSIIERYRATPYPGRVILLRSREFRERGQFGRWWDIAAEVEAHDLPTTHVAMMREPDVALVAKLLSERIEQLEEDDG